jgi:hypothetical protein
MMHTQRIRLTKYLNKYKGITTLQAVEQLGILRLSERIRELEKEGHRINRFRITVKNRFNEDCRVMKYCLAK